MNTGNFWKGKRVLITGHTGFKGGWLSQLLIHLEADLSGYSLKPEGNPNFFDAVRLDRQMRSEIGDVTDFSSLNKVVKDVQPEIILHLAAQPLVRLSYDQPLGTFNTNVMGTANLLEAARQQPSVRAFVNVTTDKCYENTESLRGYREGDPLGGHDPYAASKACSELVTSSYRRSFFAPHDRSSRQLAVASARAGNVLGGGDWSKDRIIPDIVRRLLVNKSVGIRNANAIRPWQHVLDPLSGYLLLAEKLYSGEPVDEAWNFGPDEESFQNVAWLTDYVCKKFGEAATWFIEDEPQPHESIILKLDCAKAHRRLQWESKLDIRRTLDWTIEWYQRYQDDSASIQDYTIQQIDDFLELH